MAFRLSISQDELRQGQTDEDRERHATTYQASRGGWCTTEPKPTPGAGETGRNGGS
ncbi:hypothetical protein [Streptomyces virginiae]|uniref:hypothetical protein n=1 Tax=Streptomyces virginiae TaxID=1961 RepID=UPI0033309AA5